MILIEFYRIRKTNYLNRVLLLNNGGDLLIGKPYLESVKIKGKILEHLRGKKTIVYKMRPKKKLERNKVTDKN
jgi:large subunit ribosomal protein L21